MSRICFSLLLVLFSIVVHTQEIFKKGDFFGLKYDGVEYYAAVFNQIKIHEYFIEGRIGTTYYNLSKKKGNSEKAYRKFSYKLLDRLVVVGYTTSGTVDLLNETGEIFYLTDGPYDRILNKNHLPNYSNDDMLTVRKNGKVGLYNWVLQKEVLPAEYIRVIVHESCIYGQHFIYGRKAMRHTIWNEKGEKLLSFKAFAVTDIYPDDICEGFIIQWHYKIGYSVKKRDGSFFLLKPTYDEIYFPKGNASVIIVERREKFGIYVNYKRMLKCKYDNITWVDDPYSVAVVEKDGVEWKLMNNGDLELIRY